jgi:hypothetical protein
MVKAVVERELAVVPFRATPRAENIAYGDNTTYYTPDRTPRSNIPNW